MSPDRLGPFILLAVVMLGLTVWRVRRREYRELATSWVWTVCFVGALVALVELRGDWSAIGFWTLSAIGVIALLVLPRRTRAVQR